MDLTEKMTELQRLHQVCMDIYRSIIEKGFQAKKVGFTLGFLVADPHSNTKKEFSSATHKLLEYFMETFNEEAQNTENKQIFIEFYEMKLKIDGLVCFLEHTNF